MRRYVHSMDDVAMALPQRYERPARGTNGAKELSPVRSDGFLTIPFRRAEIQDARFPERARAAGTRAESVNEPGEMLKASRAQKREAAGPGRVPSGTGTVGNRAIRGAAPASTPERFAELFHPMHRTV
jgi:hypothetical protein